MPGTYLARGNGTAGNWAAGESALNYAKGDRFSTRYKLLSDLEIKKGDFGGLVRIKAWYDEALINNNVRFGHEGNGYNGTRVPAGCSMKRENLCWMRPTYLTSGAIGVTLA